MFVDLGTIAVDVPLDTVRQVRFDQCHGLPDRTGDTDWCLVADPENVEADAALAIVGGVAVTVFEGFPNRGEVFEKNDRARGGADNRYAGELPRPVTPVGDPQQDVSATGFYRPAGDLGRGGIDDLRDLVESQVVGAQALLRHVDMDLQVTRAGEVDLGDAWILQQSVADLLCRFAQGHVPWCCRRSAG